MNGTFKAVERWQSHQLRCPKDLDELLRGFRPLFAYHDHLLEGREIPLATVEEFFKTGAVSQFSGDPKDLMLLQGQRNCYEYLRERVLARDDLETSLVLEVHRILTSGTYTEPFYLVNGERPGELKKRDYVTAVNAVGAAARARKARLVVLAADAADNTLRRAAHFAQAGSAPAVQTPYTKGELGLAVGRSSCAMLALTDHGLAASFARKLAEADGEQYGDTAAALEEKAQRACGGQALGRPRQAGLPQGGGGPEEAGAEGSRNGYKARRRASRDVKGYR